MSIYTYIPEENHAKAEELMGAFKAHKEKMAKEYPALTEEQHFICWSTQRIANLEVLVLRLHEVLDRVVERERKKAVKQVPRRRKTK
ncbi:hypothetical protein [Horticoccus sp. 23ND18S-11]|uniref:hypothetical protein n=1 Tax=Horticoccus sp. 23ND18S-11 TaxID=3391832 RepID=UPI0039C9690B